MGRGERVGSFITVAFLGEKRRDYFSSHVSTGHFFTMRISVKSYLGVAVLSILAGANASAQTSGQQILKAIPDQRVCQSQGLSIGSQPVKGTLCVTQGKFDHDSYAFDINGKVVLSGVDDDTTKGVTGNYNGQPVRLTCKPELKKPADDDPMVAGMAKSLASKPGVSEQQAHKMAVAMLTTEVGRQCLIEGGSQTLMDVSIYFD